MPKKQFTKALIGIPTTSGARRSVQWIDSLANIQMPLGCAVGRAWVEDAAIADARNQLCEQAIAVGAQYLFFISDDVMAPPNVLLLMLDKIGREYPIEGGSARATMITGVYWTKAVPPEPYLWNLPLLSGSFTDWKAGEFFPVDLAGCDCLMIDVEALKSVPKPWFSTDWAWDEGQESSPIATEDFYFFTKMRKHGYRLFADTAIQCMHEDRTTGVAYGLTMDMRQAGGEPEFDAGELVADIGAGFVTQGVGVGCKLVRFDMRPETKPDYVCDVRNIPEQFHGKFDAVNVGHVLEHFDRADAPEMVRRWAKLLKPGGRLVVRVPNIAYAMKRILDAEDGKGHADNYDWAQVYGDQEVPGPAARHTNGFTPKKLRALFTMLPEFSEVKVEETGEGGEPGINLKATAIVPKAIEPEAIMPWWGEIIEKEGLKVPVSAEEPEPAAV